MGDLEDIDHRSSLYIGLTQENLARHVASFARTASTPSGVADLLGEARRTFVGGAASYDNFASAALKSLQAAELALRIRVAGPSSRRTLGQLLHDPAVERVLTEKRFHWYREFALHFRNKLAHPERSMAMTPGIAEPFVRSAHQVVAELFPDD